MNQTQSLALVDMFNYQENKLRHIILEDEIWWPAIDICEILEIKNASQATENLDEDEKLLYPIHIAGQDRNVLFVNEPGLYRLVFQSRKPEAKAFQRWVYHEVLPQIRKTGGYGNPLQGLIDLDQLDQAIAKLKQIKRLSRSSVPRIARPSTTPRDALIAYLTLHKQPVTVRELSQYAPLSIRALKSSGIRELLIELQAIGIIHCEQDGKQTLYQM